MMQSMLSGVTTEVIQQYLDENKQLILAILQNRNVEREAECAEYQARLQRNLQYLAAIADNQAQMQATSQHPPIAAMQLAPQHMSYQHPQRQIPQSVVVAPSSILYAQQQQQGAMYRKLMTNSGVNSEFSMLNADGGQAERVAGGIEPRLYLKG